MIEHYHMMHGSLSVITSIHQKPLHQVLHHTKPPLLQILCHKYRLIANCRLLHRWLFARDLYSADWPLWQPLEVSWKVAGLDGACSYCIETIRCSKLSNCCARDQGPEMDWDWLVLGIKRKNAKKSPDPQGCYLYGTCIKTGVSATPDAGRPLRLCQSPLAKTWHLTTENWCHYNQIWQNNILKLFKVRCFLKIHVENQLLKMLLIWLVNSKIMFYYWIKLLFHQHWLRHMCPLMENVQPCFYMIRDQLVKDNTSKSDILL